MPKGTNDKVLAQNRKASHDYTILETIEAGMVLTGTEIKSVRQARINLKDGYVSLKQGEAFLVGVHISLFEQGTLFNHDPLRTRKLLLHKKQINYLLEQVKQAGNTVVPLKVYIKNGVAKLLIGVAKGKKNYDKRDALKQKDMKREIDRAMKERY
ncbi:SsrA-binding protein SmpB [uncultured Granulicatella sp.]|uniref:SsrA-binding protein SmpB n=1 Tax=uncultured Granulicatella sp. TaxID=316089 RepID=UPI00260FBA6A|nr:SsrA-binding protein SmpB [uncultured Granulicatella sp.]